MDTILRPIFAITTNLVLVKSCLIFYFSEPTDIHACLGMASVANISPPLQQGKKKNTSYSVVPFCYYLSIFVGATASASWSNLYTWLDAVAHSLNLGNSFARGVQGHRLRGMYHHLRAEDMATFRGVLLDKLAIWGQEAMAVGTSCGSAVEVGGGTGNGLYVREVPICPRYCSF